MQWHMSSLLHICEIPTCKEFQSQFSDLDNESLLYFKSSTRIIKRSIGLDYESRTAIVPTH